MTHTIVKRSEALAAGLPRYFTGNPCKHGHLSERQSTSGNCIECWYTTHRGARKEYIADYTREHKKILRHSEPYRPKYLAHKAVKRAIKNGSLVRQPCEVCGNITNVEAHHEDYSRRLDVKWLCKLHHEKRHMEIEAAKSTDGSSNA